jgi:hypothetical protein
MKLRLHHLVVHSKTNQEDIAFVDFNYFHGRMGAGKSTIARLIDFCLGGTLAYTPALQAEFVAATLQLTVNDTEVQLTRNRDENQIRAQWTKQDDAIDLLLPARQASGEVLPKSGIENLSDLLFFLADIHPPMVRRSKVREESELVRLSFRDLFWYCYLDQDSMDSSFFRLDDSNHSIRLKSVDVLRLVIGFHQQQVSEFQVKLEQTRSERQKLEEAAVAIRAVLSEEGIASAHDIERAIDKARTDSKTAQQELEELRTGIKQASIHATESLRKVCRELADELAEVDNSTREMEVAIQNDRAHRNSLLNLAVRQRRAQGAKEALTGVEFKHCPQCYQSLPSRPADVCAVCGQVHGAIPSSPIDDLALEADIRSRADELEAKMSLESSALDRLRRQRVELSEEKKARDLELNKASTRYDSAYLSQSLEHEKRIARLGQRIIDLRQLLALANKVVSMEERAKKLLADEAILRARLRDAREHAERDTSNLDRLKELFLQCLLRAKMPGFFADDAVVMRAPWFLPEVIGKNTGDFAVTSFETLGSGGKKTLFKCCFALALHLLAREQNASLPTLLIIDSPMKNISERENREQFVGFNQMLYDFACNELRDIQFIVIDKEYDAPRQALNIGFFERYMTPDDSEHPPLLKAYRGK